jgi:hypothetical protein
MQCKSLGSDSVAIPLRVGVMGSIAALAVVASDQDGGENAKTDAPLSLVAGVADKDMPTLPGTSGASSR